MPHAAVVVGALLRRRWRLVALVALLGAGLAALALQQLHVAQSSSSSSGNGRYGIPLLRRHRPATAALAAPTALPRHVVVVHTHPATGQQGSDARLDQVCEGKGGWEMSARAWGAA